MPVITDLRMTRGRRARIEVCIDGAPGLDVEPDVAVLFHLKKGLELGEERLEEIVHADERLRARQALARYTALAARSERQARAALGRRPFSSRAIEAAIEYGRERGWIDDRSFAAAAVRRRASGRPAGPARMRADLAAKGIAPEVADEAIARFGPDEESQKESARRLALRRLPAWQTRHDAAELRRRLRDYLLRQGYESDMVSEVVKEVLE